MKTVFKAVHYGLHERIEEIQIQKETETQVVWEGDRPVREQKYCVRHKYFDTFEEAKTYLLSHHKCEITHAQAALRSAQRKFDEIDSMTKALKRNDNNA